LKEREREREREGKMRLAHELWFGREQWVGAKSVMDTRKEREREREKREDEIGS
jgi:hypothetical protein